MLERMQLLFTQSPCDEIRGPKSDSLSANSLSINVRLYISSCNTCNHSLTIDVNTWEIKHELEDSTSGRSRKLKTGMQNVSGLGTGVPAVGSRVKAPVPGLEDEVPRSWSMFVCFGAQEIAKFYYLYCVWQCKSALPVICNWHISYKPAMIEIIEPPVDDIHLVTPR